jgi:DNA-binding transcriptional MerR regulator
MKLTLPELSRRSQVSRLTLRHYADSGLIPCQYASDGSRLFDEEAVDQARKVRDSRTRKAAPVIEQAGNG